MHKKENIKLILKIISSVLAVSLVVYTIVSAIFGTFNFTKWHENYTEAEFEEKSAKTGGLVVTPTDGRLMSLTATPLSASSDDGIATVSDEGYTITATVKDENGQALAQYQTVTYSMSWATSKSAAVSTYVNMTTSGTTATFTCLQAFDTQIIVTCTSTLDTSIKATATLDYYQRMTVNYSSSVEWSQVGSSGTPGDFVGNTFTYYTAPSFGTGSLTNKVNSYSVTITASTAFLTALQNCYGSIYGSISVSSSLVYTGGTIVPQATLMSDLTGLGASAMTSSYCWQQAVAETSNQLTVSVSITPDYGTVQTYSYTVNLSVAEASVASLSLSSTSIVI